MMEKYERRRPGELTTEYLGRVLEDYLHLPEVARRARLGHFDDYFCPPEVDDGLNLHRLLEELLRASKGVSRDSPQLRRITLVMIGVKEGEFDGTSAEAKRWSASKEGQEILKELLPRDK